LASLNEKTFQSKSGIKLDSYLQNCEAKFSRGGSGASSMSAVLSDVVLFGCTAASISWLIIQPASLLN
jgi:hypothetical protein